MVSGGHNNITPYSLTYSSVVYRDSVRIYLSISSMIDSKFPVFDINNAYVTVKFRRIYGLW